MDPSKIAVAGTSAGGNLAAVVALMATDKGGPRLAGQVLIYPVIERNFDRRSYQENREGYLLTRSAMEWFWKLYLRADSDADHPYAAPIKANDLRWLAPALVITAEFDPLRDEGEAYAKRLSEADVPTVCTRYGGMFHGFFDIFDGMDKSEAALRQVSQALNAAFAGRLRSARHRTTR